MKRTLFALVSALALMGSPAPAHARNIIFCMLEAVSECDERFPPSDYRNVSIRGWCYMISTAICAAN
jgi:hypothetical protein